MTRHDQPSPEFEARLRASLAERAADASASPAMWDKVQTRIDARRRLRLLAIAGSSAVAVLAAAVVVPNLLDRGPRSSGITVEPSPTGSSSPAPADPATPHALADPTTVLVASGSELLVLDAASGDVASAPIALAGEPVQIAARPQVNPDRFEVAYVLAVDGGWQLRVVTTAPPTSSGGGDVELVTNANGRVDDLPPGVAWSPDGRFVAWMTTIDDGAGPTTSVQVIDWMAQIGEGYASGEVVSDVGGRFELADGASTGRLTLKSWTWDHQYEDGRDGRLLLTGDGRSWQVGITHSFGLDVYGLDPIDVADDFDDAGPDYGVYALLATPDGFFEVRATEERASTFTVSDSWDEADGVPDFAAVNDHFVVSLGSRLLIGSWDGETMTLGEGGPRWGAVDLVQDPWLPVYEPAGDPPATNLPPVGEVASLPDHIVTTDGTSIDLRWSDGEFIQTLTTVTQGSEVIGLEVRPGSSTEDLTVVATLARDRQLSVVTLRGRADDQAGLVVEVLPWPAAYQPDAGASVRADGELTVPAFSDDGAFVAFVENTAVSTNLRIFGWQPDADLPGTGRTADDNVAFDRGTVPMSLESFTGPGTSRGGGIGYVIEMTGSDGTASACEYERQSDGALAEIICEADRASDSSVVDLTNHVLLERRGNGLILLDQDRSYAQQDEYHWPLPVDVAGGDPTAVWMTGRSDHVFVGVDGLAWLVTPEGAQQLPDGITWIAGVR